MATDASNIAAENADKFYTVIKSMHEFDTTEVKGVIDTVISPTPHETCFIGTYYRARPNVETLLLLTNVKDLQAIAMLARALFELSIDSRLFENIPGAWVKMQAFTDAQKLYAAKKIIDFKRSHADFDVDTSVAESFVAKNSARIARVSASLWPGVRALSHWSGMKLSQRVATVKAPFEQIYANDYPRLSWYVHPGLTGVANLPPETFIHLCTYAYHIASIAYGETLMSLVRAFKLSRANEKIEEKLRVAKMLPFTKDAWQADMLMSFGSVRRDQGGGIGRGQKILHA
jgi:hypothetical protein